MSIFTVTTLTDENDGIDVGGVSLREAIAAANAKPGRDIIRFNSRLSGTISLTQGELAISDSVVIRGLGADTLTIDAGGNSRVFNINDDSDDESEVTIQGLTISGGYTQDNGGGIYNAEALKVIDTVITNNTSSYRYYEDYYGDPYYYNGDGAGIFQYAGSLLVKNSEISSNSADDDGGGIYTYSGDVRVINSDIVNNSADSSGGGIYASSGDVRVTNSDIAENNSYSGGGIYVAGANVRVTDSDIADNSADYSGGGIYASSGDVRVTDSDIAENNSYFGGGIYARNNSDVGFVRSVVTQNSAEYGGGIYNDGTTSVKSSSITENSATSEGGGVHNSGTFKASNSTIAGNTMGEGESEFPSEFYGPAGVTVAGTQGEDEIFGTNGDDIIRGRDGDDILAGGAGDDKIFGQAGSDVLIGFDPLIGSPVPSESGTFTHEDEIDVLTGGGGADKFVLGGFFGIEPEASSAQLAEIEFSMAYSASGDDDYALIRDFTAQDKILLDGDAELYQLGVASSGLPSGVTISTAEGELMAIVQGEAAIDLNLESGTGFEFASGLEA